MLLVGSLSAADVDEALRLSSLCSVEEVGLVSVENVWPLFSASFRAIVCFLAAALALAACTRTALLVSSLMPEGAPAEKGTKATCRLRGSSRSSVGEVSGLFDTDRDLGFLYDRGFGIGS